MSHIFIQQNEHFCAVHLFNNSNNFSRFQSHVLDLENAALYAHPKGGAPVATAQTPPTRPTYSLWTWSRYPKRKRQSYTEQSSCIPARKATERHSKEPTSFFYHHKSGWRERRRSPLGEPFTQHETPLNYYQLIARALTSGKNKTRSCGRMKGDEVVSGKEEEAGEAKERDF